MSIVKPLKEITVDVSHKTQLSPELLSFILDSHWTDSIKESFISFLYEHADIRQNLATLFSDPTLFQQTVPLMAFLEDQQAFLVIFATKAETPPEPGEPGSLLSYFRAYGYDEGVLCSDCYGQLSCSSCSIEILNGSPENPVARDEEFDMLSIDEKNPPTPFTRLSCQTLLGTEPLILTIRKYIS